MSSEPSPDEFFDHFLYDAAPYDEAPPDAAVVEWRRWWRSHLTGGRVVVGIDDLDVSRATMRHALRTGRWTTAGRGQVAPFDVRHEDRFLQHRRKHAVLAAGTVQRSATLAVTGRSAAVLYALELRTLPSNVEVTPCATGRPGVRGGRRTLSAALSEDELTEWHGAVVTTVARTLVDLARHDGEDGIIAADHALRARLVTPEEIDRALVRAAGWPGIRRAREVLRLASPKAESALESLVRLALHDAGFPPPELQRWIDGYRVDFAWPELGLVLEADGIGKYVGAEARNAYGREKWREQRLRRAGYHVERVTWAEITSGRAAFVAHLRAVFADRTAMKQARG